MRDFRDVSVRCVSDSDFFLFVFVYMINTVYVWDIFICIYFAHQVF